MLAVAADTNADKGSNTHEADIGGNAKVEPPAEEPGVDGDADGDAREILPAFAQQAFNWIGILSSSSHVQT